MKKISYTFIIILLLVSIINVHAENKYIIKNKEDINNIENIQDIDTIEIINMNLDDLSFLNNYRNISNIKILQSTININNLDEELINKINYDNTYIKGEFNNLYKYKESDKIVNTEYSINPKYDEEFSKMAKYIYVEGITDEQIVKKVTLFVLDYMELDKDNKKEDINNCYSHYGICSNYTELEAVLLNKLGIYAITINGFTDMNNEANSYHSWNMVYLNNKWYLIDPVYLDIYDSSDAIERDLSVEYYMKEETRDFRANHIAYYDYHEIPTDIIQSRISILDKLDEIDNYEPTEQPEPKQEEIINYDYLNKEIVKVIILCIISLTIIIITIKDKKKLREKITR